MVTVQPGTVPVTLWRETPCEHGYMESHYIYEHTRFLTRMRPVFCPGGSREEVTIDQLVFMVANACASHDMQSGPFDMLAELDEDMASAYRHFARKHVNAALGITEAGADFSVGPISERSSVTITEP